MRILVTGAAGYIGSALVDALSPKHDVLATDQAAMAFGSSRVEATVGNIAYPQFARALVTPDIDTVFHLASLVSGGAEQNFELGNKVNLDATRDLLEACRLAGRDYVCPVRPDTRMACISLGCVTEAFSHAAGIPAEQLKASRTMLLTGISVSAQQMWDAVRARAKGRVRFDPDPGLQKIMDAAPKSTHSRRAEQLGFRHSRNIEEIVAEYESEKAEHEKNHSDTSFARHG